MKAVPAMAAALAVLLLVAAAPASACQQNPMLFFGFGSTAPNELGRTQLQGFAAQALPRLDEIAAIEIVGHSDRKGSPAARERIAAERARAVRTLLISYGIPEKLLQATGAGDRDPLIDTGDDVREPQNRRVTLSIAFKPAARAAAAASQEQGSRPSC